MKKNSLIVSLELELEIQLIIATSQSMNIYWDFVPTISRDVLKSTK